MLYTRFHAIRKRWLPVRRAVIGAVLAGLVPLKRQQPQQPAGSATQDLSATSEPKQNPTSSSALSTKNDPNAEVAVQHSCTTFGLRVTPVQVHVVVRDANNNPVANLKQEDFQLFDPEQVTAHQPVLDGNEGNAAREGGGRYQDTGSSGRADQVREYGTPGSLHCLEV